jgi:hypothetical protein
MSSSLYWRPVPREVPPANSLPYGLKKALARRYWDHDGSLNGDMIEISEADVPYLEGIRDAASGEVSEGAAGLIEAIREYGAVEIWIA